MKEECKSAPFKHREVFLQHLDQCPDCFRVAQAALRAKVERKDNPVTPPLPATDTKKEDKAEKVEKTEKTTTVEKTDKKVEEKVETKKKEDQSFLQKFWNDSMNPFRPK